MTSLKIDAYHLGFRFDPRSWRSEMGMDMVHLGCGMAMLGLGVNASKDFASFIVEGSQS